MSKFVIYLSSGAELNLTCDDLVIEYSTDTGRALKWNAKGIEPGTRVPIFLDPTAISAVEQIS